MALYEIIDKAIKNIAQTTFAEKGLFERYDRLSIRVGHSVDRRTSSVLAPPL